MFRIKSRNRSTPILYLLTSKTSHNLTACLKNAFHYQQSISWSLVRILGSASSNSCKITPTEWYRESCRVWLRRKRKLWALRKSSKSTDYTTSCPTARPWCSKTSQATFLSSVCAIDSNLISIKSTLSMKTRFMTIRKTLNTYAWPRNCRRRSLPLTSKISLSLTREALSY